MQEIYLYNNELDDDMYDFTELLRKQHDIHALGFEMNRLGYKACNMICNALQDKNKLEKLYLNNNDINS